MTKKTIQLKKITLKCDGMVIDNLTQNLTDNDIYYTDTNVKVDMKVPTTDVHKVRKIAGDYCKVTSIKKTGQMRKEDYF